MKLRGTRVEISIREMLMASYLSIKENKQMMDFLREYYGNVRSAYVLTCTPEQGEDLYEVLINGEFILGFEISRISGEISDVEETSVAVYSKKLRGKRSNLKMLIALDLANNH
ncbi:hypothetical protein [Achromobacter xylosoxidans]|uniref:hypothetical protein n=2 Tax=Alcaligenes xylosoxydans xylosoxydans TaxID=85698 RepID=UPI000AF1766C|nr:hypothetical protein [Achromobacter xylosoxidans]QEQ22202.1 hypothetical protein F0U64_07310 [Achromobacter xylosoxidans]